MRQFIGKISNNRHFPFWLITLAVMFGLTLPGLIQEGMFMDAMLYTSVSHNLSMGIGTFWFPQFSLHNVAGLSSFHEQPPLVFGIQALFFKVLGDSMYVERLYTFLSMCITALLIALIWKEVYKDNNTLNAFAWIPILLWIIVPVCFWSYSNNMHENTMGIFTLSSVWLMLKGLQSGQSRILVWILAGVLIFSASLSKGLPGFFPLGFPFVYWLTMKKSSFSKMILQTSILVLVSVSAYFILFNMNESRESLSVYFFQRAMNRINEVPTVENRFWILYRLFTEHIPTLLIIAIVFIFGKYKKYRAEILENKKFAYLFASTGLMASAPLVLTLVQKGFYFIPSLPFFAIAASMLILPVVNSWVQKISLEKKVFQYLKLGGMSLLLIVSAVVIMNIGNIRRNKDLILDVHEIGKVVPVKSALGITPDIYANWDLQCYLIRYYNISLDTEKQNDYFLSLKSYTPEPDFKYEKLNVSTRLYTVYKKK